MNAIAEFVVKVADLVEAEGRSARSALREDGRELRDAAGRFVLGASVAVGGVVMGVIGVLLWITAVYLAVAEAAGPAWGAVSAGVTSVLLGLGCILLYRKLVAP